jgi:3-hydroxyacyl-[acyl-carrier-protein] dehydratase
MSAANNDLFSIEEISHEDGVIKAILGINVDSRILKGHFPGHPVVPGACMVQITKEVLEEVLKSPLQLKKADQLKFMTMIDPANTLSVSLEISYRYQEDSSIMAAAKLCNEDTVYFKMQGRFIIT